MMRSAVMTFVLTAGFGSLAVAETVQYHANMDGSHEVPPKQTAGTGTADVTLNTATRELAYTVDWKGLSGPATAAHFHGPADPNANAGVIVPIDGKDPTSPQKGSATLTEAQMKDVEAGKWYVNVHTAANPAGEIRGQLVKGK